MQTRSTSVSTHTYRAACNTLSPVDTTSNTPPQTMRSDPWPTVCSSTLRRLNRPVYLVNNMMASCQCDVQDTPHPDRTIMHASVDGCICTPQWIVYNEMCKHSNVPALIEAASSRSTTRNTRTMAAGSFYVQKKCAITIICTQARIHTHTRTERAGHKHTGHEGPPNQRTANNANHPTSDSQQNAP